MTSPARTRVLLVDANVALRDIVGELLADEPDFVVAGCAATAEDAVTAVAAGGLDLVLLSDHLPGVSGSAVLPRLKETQPGLIVALWTSTPTGDARADVCVYRGSTYRQLLRMLRLAVRAARPGAVIDLDGSRASTGEASRGHAAAPQ